MPVATFHAPDPEIAGKIIIDRGVCTPCDVMLVINLPQINRAVSIYLGEGKAVLRVECDEENESGGIDTLNEIDLLTNERGHAND